MVQSEEQLRTDPGQELDDVCGQLVTCRLDELHPHPSYVRHHITSNPAAMSRLEGRPVVRSPEQLRLHRALDELDWVGVIGEAQRGRPANDPVLNRADSDHYERDDSRWLWALAVRGVRA
jgi:hypothetical protein